jgi:hypothetical protein
VRRECQSWLPRQFEFLSGLPAPERKRKVLLTVQAYIDDSGVKGTSSVFVLAGFISDAEKWAEFSDAWSIHLKQSPSIRYLKMNEAVKLKGEFRSWSPAERDRKLLGCARIINQFRPHTGIYFINDLVAWKQLVPDRRIKTLADPHFHGFLAMVSAVCNEALDAGIDEQIEIIFDQHVIFGPRVSFWYPASKEFIELTNLERAERVRSILPVSPMFKDDHKFAPLQAADILAWLLRHAFSDRIPGLETVWRYPRPSGFEWLSAQILDSLPCSEYSTIWGHERIANMHKLSLEMGDDPVMAGIIEKWQKQLGIIPEPRE